MVLRTAVITTGFVLWIAAVIFGFVVLAEYQGGPGVQADPPLSWPAESNIPFSGRRPTLLVFVHPQCPCTRATMGELARVIRHGKDDVDTHVLFLHPEGFNDVWVESDLWAKAAEIPGVNLLHDKEGYETTLFKAFTSGQTLLYDRKGRLVFKGGITPSRGHEGDNAGRLALISLITTGSSGIDEHFVFGCPLNDDAGYCTQEECNKH